MPSCILYTVRVVEAPALVTGAFFLSVGYGKIEAQFHSVGGIVCRSEYTDVSAMDNEARHDSYHRNGTSSAQHFPTGTVCSSLPGGGNVRELHCVPDELGLSNGVSFYVAWGDEGPPSNGSYTVSVRAAPAFDALRVSSDVHDRLRIAAVPPFPDCAVCDGAAKTFPEDRGGGASLQKSGEPSDAGGWRTTPFQKKHIFMKACRRWCAQAKTSVSGGRRAVGPPIRPQQHSRACG